MSCATGWRPARPTGRLATDAGGATMTTNGQWRRVNRANPCPICKRPDWCARLRGRRGGALPARRVPQRCGEGGWLHRLKDGPRQERRCVRVVRLSPDGSVREDLARLARDYREAVDPGRLHQLAVSLGLSVTSLCQLGVGWSANTGPGPSR